MTEMIKAPVSNISDDNNLLEGLHGLLSNGNVNLSSLLKESMSFTQIKNKGPIMEFIKENNQKINHLQE